MTRETRFQGFSEGTLAFLGNLKKNNTKEWFQDHKDEFENELMAPSRAFVVDMGARLKTLSPDIQADPKVNGSLFRLHRDTRFSKDKSPYKTNIGIMFWEGVNKRTECPSMYFHLEETALMLGAGLYQFSPPQLTTYRNAVIHPVLGPALKNAVDAVGLSSSGCSQSKIPIQCYKRVPQGYDANHPNADLLKYKGLHAGISSEIPAEFYTADLIDYCLERYKQFFPLHKWLVEAIAA